MKWQLFHILKLCQIKLCNIYNIFLHSFLIDLSKVLIPSFTSKLPMEVFNLIGLAQDWACMFKKLEKCFLKLFTIWKLHISWLKWLWLCTILTLYHLSNFNYENFFHEITHFIWKILKKGIWFVQKLKGRC